MFTSSNRTECIVSQNIRHLKLVFVSVNSKQKIGGVSFLNFVFLLPELIISPETDVSPALYPGHRIRDQLQIELT